MGELNLSISYRVSMGSMLGMKVNCDLLGTTTYWV